MPKTGCIIRGLKVIRYLFHFWRTIDKLFQYRTCGFVCSFTSDSLGCCFPAQPWTVPMGQMEDCNKDIHVSYMGQSWVFKRLTWCWLFRQGDAKDIVCWHPLRSGIRQEKERKVPGHCWQLSWYNASLKSYSRATYFALRVWTNFLLCSKLLAVLQPRFLNRDIVIKRLHHRQQSKKDRLPVQPSVKVVPSGRYPQELILTSASSNPSCNLFEKGF